MRDVKRAGLAVCGAAFVAMAAVVSGQSARAPWTSITAERLLAPEPGDWMNYRRTYDVTGFSPLQQINRTNVEWLRPVWAYTMRDISRWLPTPVVANGLMYVAEGSGRVVAFDVVTGDVVWTRVRMFPDDISTSEAYPRHRGVSVYRDRIYWGTADSYLLALDARTGETIWEVKTGDYRTGEGHNHPPLIAEGKVFIGRAGGDFGARGRFDAYDAETGAHLWTFYTVPAGPGDPGFESWALREVQPAGGAPWNTASYDPELRLVYVPTGQPGLWSSAARGPGDALFTNAIIALDAQTGALRWHFQMPPADDWDRAAYEGMLVDLEIGGVMRKALIMTGKAGWGVVLDRQTGEFLHAFKTAYDNVIMGWTPQGRPIINPETVPRPADIGSGKVFQICPHLHGARNLQAPSYSPITGFYYLGVNNSCQNSTVTMPRYAPGRVYGGFTASARLAPGYDYVGEFVAFNPVTGEREWVYRPESGSAMTASALATSGGLVFGGTADRQFFALDANTGERLWQMRLNGDISGAPVTFEIDGTQYVAVGAGGRAGPTTTLGPLTGVDIPQGGGGVMWVFALPDAVRTNDVSSLPSSRTPTSESGTAARAAQDAPTLTTVQSLSSSPPPSPLRFGVFTTAQADRGGQVYKQSCSMCHDIGDHSGASFTAKWSGNVLGDIFQQMTLTMPPANPGGLSPEEYASLIAFFLQRTGYPAGDQELPADMSRLRRMPIAP